MVDDLAGAAGAAAAGAAVALAAGAATVLRLCGHVHPTGAPAYIIPRSAYTISYSLCPHDVRGTN
jgi:hypothetical protein